MGSPNLVTLGLDPRVGVTLRGVLPGPILWSSQRMTDFTPPRLQAARAITRLRPADLAS